MDPKDRVLYCGWILYKNEEEGEKDISFFLGNLRRRLRRVGIGGLRAHGLSVMKTKGLVG
jgi:hypothetical protein